MTLEVIQGDLFDPDHDFDALAQGVNTYGIMGAGIAVPFRTKFPKMYEDYQAFCDIYRAVAPGIVHYWPADPYLYEEVGGVVAEKEPTPAIFNLFSQIAPGPNADYVLLEKAALTMRIIAEASDGNIQSVGMPWIGCGIGGLQKHNVLHILKRTLRSSYVEFTIVEQA